MNSPGHRVLLPRSCDYCATTEKVDMRRCAGCKAVHYCTIEHQTADWKRHKRGCVPVKKARVSYEEEEQKLRDHPGDLFLPPDVFENGVGIFWGITETRPYMRARYNWIDTMMMLFGASGGRTDVVRTSLDALLDMLRLCRGDNMGLWNIVPSMYIRLNRDQEAYDFMYWWATTGDKPDYEWGNPDLPFLDTKNADILEPPLKAWSRGLWLDLSHAANVTLVKIRLALDLQTAQAASSSHGKSTPQQIIESVRGQLVGSILTSRPELLSGGIEEISHRVETLKNHIKQMYDSVNEYNPHFWKLMLSDPQGAAARRPGPYAPKSEEQACLMIGYIIASWVETRGAFDTMRDLSKIS